MKTKAQPVAALIAAAEDDLLRLEMKVAQRAEREILARAPSPA